jgi:hypothetical protein
MVLKRCSDGVGSSKEGANVYGLLQRCVTGVVT